MELRRQVMRALDATALPAWHPGSLAGDLKGACMVTPASSAGQSRRAKLRQCT